MYHTPTKETMAQYDYQQQFEAEPERNLSFHDAFNKMLESRLLKVNISADKLSKVYDIHTREEMHPVAVNAFNPKFAHEILKEHVPEVEMKGVLSAFDKENALSNIGIAKVEKVGQGDHYDPEHEGYLEDTPESLQSTAASEARARIASLPFAA